MKTLKTCDLIASNTGLKTDHAQEVLEIIELPRRLKNKGILNRDRAYSPERENPDRSQG